MSLIVQKSEIFFFFSRTEFDFSAAVTFFPSKFFLSNSNPFSPAFFTFFVFLELMDSLNDLLVQFFKAAIHELLLTGSCHAVLFRGFINRHLLLQPPTHGYNTKVEDIYGRLCESLGVRLKKMILDDQSFMHWENIHHFINECTTCLYAVEELYQLLQVYVSECTTPNTKHSLELYMYSIHHIGYKIQLLLDLYKQEYMSEQDSILSQAADLI